MQLASLVATFQVCFTCFILLCLRHPILAALVPATSLQAASRITRQEMRTVWVAGPSFFQVTVVGLTSCSAALFFGISWRILRTGIASPARDTLVQRCWFGAF